MDKFTLLAANAVILVVFSIAFLAAFRDMKRARYWRTWTVANLVLASALIFVFARAHLPAAVAHLVPNGLFLAGFALHWNAARQFAGNKPCGVRIWMPLTILVAAGLPALAMHDYALIYTVTSVMLSALAFGTAREYWDMKATHLSSRHGLTLAYVLVGISFLVRVIQGVANWQNVDIGLPSDAVQTFHMLISLIYVSASGAFSLAIAFEQAVAEQRDAAHRDPLTGVYNRREFELRLKALLSDEARKAFAVLQFDLDHFKQVNDRFGHVAGDEALQFCADLIKWHLRDEDCLARLGGEEFAAILPDVSQEDAVRIAEAIRQSVAEAPLDFAPAEFRLTLSAGVYHGTGGDLGHKGLMRCVDQGLYQSKNTGRNRVCLADAA
ncbi:GGDEF domain-containing protein [uncultured Roseibium sp.]|uniref:GGDEF domain-containing protein n=1 Tax=uncultured Roseibium sp. TaxID=1936171 RepID=UPI0032179E96